MSGPVAKPTRLPLGRTNRRFPFERRAKLWLTALAVPGVALTAGFTFAITSSIPVSLATATCIAMLQVLASSFFFEQLIRPLQTLSNVVAALREDDFSFRARGARRGDALGDLALEINSLASTLQHQRASALDALTLVERVLSSMQSPVLAFDESGQLRLLNAAARSTFDLPANAIGASAAQLRLGALLELPDLGLYKAPSSSAASARWSVRRSSFRLHGLPHTLLVLSDVSAALREEERTAWQRLIRVLSHEINNSLTPIHSIASTLRSRLNTAPEVKPADLRRGLEVIEDRSASLNRFLQAYQSLARLPAPTKRLTEVAQLLSSVVALDTRLPVALLAGPAVSILCDPDQIKQALINLIRNAIDATLSAGPAVPEISVHWSTDSEVLTISVQDNGVGIANTANLFVPFYTTKPNGSGIGLVLAQQIATAHQGTVTITANADNAGCLTSLTLPLW